MAEEEVAGDDGGWGLGEKIAPLGCEICTFLLLNFVAIPGDAVQSDQNAADDGGWGAGKVLFPNIF